MTKYSYKTIFRPGEVQTFPAQALHLHRFEPSRLGGLPRTGPRRVYTIRFARAVYVLHAFQKKAKKGIATPMHEIERIKARLQDAEEHYRAYTEKGERKP